MKKFAKSLLSTALFLTYASKTYATENITESNSGIGKIALLGIGVILIALVLFIGYKLDSADNSDEVKPKKEKIKKEKVEKQSKQIANENKENEIFSEDVYKTANEEDVPYEIEENEKYETDKINLSEINENTEYTDDGDEESLFESISKVKGYDTFIDDDDFDEIDTSITDVSENEMDSDKSKKFDSTMVFDTNIFGDLDEKKDTNNTKVEEYDGLDDFDLEKNNSDVKNDEKILINKDDINDFEKETTEENDEIDLEEDIDIYKFKPTNNIEESFEEIDSEEDFESEDIEEIEVVDLDSKIDELDDYVEESEHDIFGNLPNVVSLPPKDFEDDLEDEFEEIEKNKNVIVENEDFYGFTVEEQDENIINKESAVKRFTRKKQNSRKLTSRPYPKSEESNEEIFNDLPNVITASEQVKEEIVPEEQETELVDYSFLAQMEENLVKTKNKRLGIEEVEKDKTKKTTKTTAKKDTKKSSESKTKSTSKKTTEKKATTKESSTKKETKSKSTEKAKTTTKKK